MNENIGKILNAVRLQDPRFVTGVLLCLDVSPAAAVFQGLPFDAAIAAARNMSEIGRLDSDVLRNIDRFLKNIDPALELKNAPIEGGVAPLVEILNLTHIDIFREILSRLETVYPDIEEQISRRMFVFEDIVLLSDAELGAALAAADDFQLAMALKNVDEEVLDKVFRSIPKESAAVKEEMERLGPVTLEDMKEAQWQIINGISTLRRTWGVRKKETEKRTGGEKRVFAFNDIVRLEDRSMQKLLWELDNETVALALLGAEDEVKNKFYRNISKRRAAVLRWGTRHWAYTGETEEKRKKIIAMIKGLEYRGEILVDWRVESGVQETSREESAPEARGDASSKSAEDSGEISLDLVLSQDEGPPMSGNIGELPEHNLNWDEFVHYYYEIVTRVYRFQNKAWREGLLALEEELEFMPEDGYFKTALRLVLDGTDCEEIRFFLALFLEQEHDPYKITLKRVQMEGILGIQAMEYWPRLLAWLNALVDIPGNKISVLLREYDRTVDPRVFRVLAEGQGVCHDLPAEREEVRFIKRVIALHKAWHKGFPALEAERDLALFAREDVLECGLAFVIDGEEPECIAQLLDLLIEREHDPWKKRLARAKKEAVLSIQAGNNPWLMREMLLAYFDKHVRELVDRVINRELG